MISPGTRIGPYRVLRSLGQGAMGAVVLGEHVEFGALHALKLLPTELAQDPVLVERFRREMRSLAQLGAHPRIVGVHSEGTTSTGQLFFAMDYVEGRSLSQAMRQALDWKDGARVLLDVADALAYAHARGVVHRDVKPENVLVDAEGRGHLADFGLAFVRQAGTRLTRSEEVLGTPAYMAPEQIQGEVGPAADTYSLGVILYQLTAGQLPFGGDTLIEILAKASREIPLGPSDLVPGLDPRVDAVCLRALAARPTSRYPSVSAFADDLRALLAGEAPTAVAPHRRLPWSTLAALALVLGIVGGGIALVVHGLGRQRAFAALEEQVAQLEADGGDPREGLSALAAARAAAAAEGFPELEARLAAREPALRERALAAAWEQGDLGFAAEALGAGATHPELAWILAAGAGDYARAREAPGFDALPPDQRARLAAWAEDAAGCQAALDDAGPLGHVLAHRLRRFVEVQEPAGELAPAWRRSVACARALAEGDPLAAELALADADDADLDSAHRRERRLLRLDLAFLRDDPEDAQAQARRLLEEAPDLRARGLVTAALADWAPALAPLELEGARLAPGLPPVRQARERLTGAPVRGSGPLAQARAAWAAAGPVLSESPSRLDLAACARGADGAPGVIAAELSLAVEVALRQEPPQDQTRALAQELALARALRPESVALARAEVQLARLRRDAEAADAALARALALAPRDPLVLVEAGRLQAGQAAADAEARFVALLDGAPPPAAPALAAAEQAFARALELASPALATEVRLAWADALLEASWGEATLGARLRELLAPLLAEVELEPLRAARRAVAAALVAGDPEPLRAAEEALARRAAALTPAHTEALRLVALAGGDGARAAAEGVFATGDALAGRLRAAEHAGAAHTPREDLLAPSAVLRAAVRRAPEALGGWALLGRALAATPEAEPALAGALSASPPVLPPAGDALEPRARAALALARAVAVAARGFRADELAPALAALRDARWTLPRPAAADLATAHLIAAGVRLRRLPPSARAHAERALRRAALGQAGGYAVPALRLCLRRAEAELADYDAVAAAGSPAALRALIAAGWAVQGPYDRQLERSMLDFAASVPWPTWHDEYAPSEEVRQLELAMRINVMLRDNNARIVSRGQLEGHQAGAPADVEALSLRAQTLPRPLQELAALATEVPAPVRGRLASCPLLQDPAASRRDAAARAATLGAWGQRPRPARSWDGAIWFTGSPPPRVGAWLPDRWISESLRLVHGPLELEQAADLPRSRPLGEGLGRPLSPERVALEEPTDYRGAMLLLQAIRKDDADEAVLAAERVTWLGRGWSYDTALLHALNPLRAGALRPDLSPETRARLLLGAIGIARAADVPDAPAPIAPALLAQLYVDAAGFELASTSREAWLARARAALEREERVDAHALHQSEFAFHTQLRRARVAAVLGDDDAAAGSCNAAYGIARTARDVSSGKLFTAFGVVLALHASDPWRERLEALPEWRALRAYMQEELR